MGTLLMAAKPTAHPCWRFRDANHLDHTTLTVSWYAEIACRPLNAYAENPALHKRQSRDQDGLIFLVLFQNHRLVIHAEHRMSWLVKLRCFISSSPQKDTYLKYPETAEDKKPAHIIHSKMLKKAQNGGINTTVWPSRFRLRKHTNRRYWQLGDSKYRVAGLVLAVLNLQK